MRELPCFIEVHTDEQERFGSDGTYLVNIEYIMWMAEGGQYAKTVICTAADRIIGVKESLDLLVDRIQAAAANRARYRGDR